MTDTTTQPPLPEATQAVFAELDDFGEGLPERVAAAIANENHEGDAVSLRKDIEDKGKKANKRRLEQSGPFRDMVARLNKAYENKLGRWAPHTSALTTHINGVVDKRRKAAKAQADAEQAEADEKARVSKAAEDAKQAAADELERAHNQPEKAAKLAAQLELAEEVSATAAAAALEAQATADAEPVKVVPQSSDGRTTYEQPTWASTLDNFGLVPDEFKVLNASAVKDALKAGRTIPGITLKTGPESFTVVVRGSRVR